MNRPGGPGSGRLVGMSGAAACALAALALAPSPAAAFTRTSSFSSSDITRAQDLAVDRRGDMFITEAEPIPGAGFNTIDATKIVELSPAGKKMRTIRGDFTYGGQRLWVNGAVAVTPNGREVFMGGIVTPDGSTNRAPFVAGYSTATGKFVRGTEFDQSTTHFGGPVAVDSTGTHVYVADGPDFYSPKDTPNRIFELNVSGLSAVGEFTLHGSAASERVSVVAIAVGGPGDDVYVDIDPPHGASFVQVYQPDGTFIRQVAAASGAGVAVDAAGEFFAGGPRGFDVHRPDGTLREPGVATARSVTAEAVDGFDDLFGLERKGNGQSIVKFAPVIPVTRLIGEPPPPLVLILHSPTATFRFKSATIGSTFECGLDRRGFDPASYSPCTSPQTYKDLPNGSYALFVRAVSSDGAPDPTPAVVRFKVLVAYAHAVITSHPATLIGRARATFKFSSTTPGATFQCRLTKFLRVPRAFMPCSSPITYHGLVHDVYSFQVQAITRRGFVQPDAAGYQFAVDPVPPAVSSPVASIFEGEEIGPSGSTTVDVNWSAADPNTPSGELLDSLQQRTAQGAGAFGAWSTVPGSNRQPGLTYAYVALAPGASSYEFRARAENKLGIVGTSAPGGRLGVSLIDNGDRTVSYPTNGWVTVADSHAIGGTVAEANTAGAKVTLQFTGTSLGVVGVPAPGRGELEVCIDPGTSSEHCSTVETNQASKRQRELLYARNGLPNTQHTVRITAKTAPVVLDAFIAIQ